MRLIDLTVNGRKLEIPVAEDELLLDTLRERVGCTSVREGCGVGACGACTVLVGGRSVSSCLARSIVYHESEVQTADGLDPDDDVVQAFEAENAMQCGYCIPGFVMMTHELLSENADPDESEVAAHLEGNLCRCGTYREICAAVRRAARQRSEVVS